VLNDFSNNILLEIKNQDKQEKAQPYISTRRTASFNMVVQHKVVNSVSVDVLFFQLEWNVSVSKCFGVPFRGCTVHIYIYIYIYIYI